MSDHRRHMQLLRAKPLQNKWITFVHTLFHNVITTTRLISELWFANPMQNWVILRRIILDLFYSGDNLFNVCYHILLYMQVLLVSRNSCIWWRGMLIWPCRVIRLILTAGWSFPSRSVYVGLSVCQSVGRFILFLNWAKTELKYLKRGKDCISARANDGSNNTWFLNFRTRQTRWGNRRRPTIASKKIPTQILTSLVSTDKSVVLSFVWVN